MIAWAVLKPILLKHGLSIVLVGLLVGQQVSSGIQLRRLTSQLNESKTQLAQAMGTIAQLNDAVKNLPVGQSKTIYVDRPFPVTITRPGEVQIVEKQVPVIVTRTEKTIETKVETLTLPPKEIQTIVDKSPQSLIFNLEAARDIAKGEKFRVIAAQIQPGVFQAVLDIGAPVTGTVTTVTPVERIPTPPVPQARLTLSLLTGYSSYFAAPLAGVRADYKLSPHWGLEASFDHVFRNPATQDFRLLAILSF